ncbi:MAG: regulatory protein LuxR [Flavipsychrobacter sp.]|nr:regulatory protein LuxR [Flavipsychrobacter sp.]
MNTHTEIKMTLTCREKEILSYIAEGFSSKQIAGKLFISENTVANHRRNMLRKRGAKSSAQLVSVHMRADLN